MVKESLAAGTLVSEVTLDLGRTSGEVLMSVEASDEAEGVDRGLVAGLVSWYSTLSSSRESEAWRLAESEELGSAEYHWTTVNESRRLRSVTRNAISRQRIVLRDTALDIFLVFVLYLLIG